jgi:hypothetical protein
MGSIDRPKNVADATWGRLIQAKALGVTITLTLLAAAVEAIE